MIQIPRIPLHAIKGPRSRRVTIVVVLLLIGYILLRSNLHGGPEARPPNLGSQDTTVKQRSLPVEPTVEQALPAESETVPRPEQSGFELQDVGGDVLESPAGLRYGPGSREGHRLKHVLRHGKDEPNRPGKHGVFAGDRAAILALLDDAFRLALEGDARAQVKTQGPRKIYTVDMERRIGFVGGQVGNRQNRPAANYVRLVLEGKYVITAFPFRP